MPFQVLTNIMMSLVAATDALLILLFSKETLLEELMGCGSHRENLILGFMVFKKRLEIFTEPFLVLTSFILLIPFPMWSFFSPLH